MGEIINEGILTNLANIYDATGFRTPEAQLVYDDKYRGGSAITCSKPDTIIFDTEEIRAGQLSGTYSIGFYYDSSTATVQGTPLMRFEIYEDGVLMPEDTSVYSDGTVYEYDLNFVNYGYLYGLHDTKVFKATSSYQIIVKTSESLTNDAILDYVTLARHGENGVINGRPITQSISMRNVGKTENISNYGTQLTIETVRGGFTGTMNSQERYSATYPYSTPFKTIRGAWVNVKDPTGKIFANCSNKNYTNNTVTLTFANVSSSSWSSSDTDNIQIIIVGYI